MQTSPRASTARQPSSPPPFGGMRLLESSEVKALLGYSDNASFWSMVRAAGMPFIKLNARRIMFEESAVKAWLDTRTVGRRTRDFPARMA